MGMRSDIASAFNFNHIPVHSPKCPFHSYHRDGKMRTDGNLGATTTYNPNSQGLWDNQPEYAEPPLTLEGDADHYDHRLEDDHWEQPANLFRKMTPEQNSCSSTTRPVRSYGASREVMGGMLRTAEGPILHMAMVWHSH